MDRFSGFSAESFAFMRELRDNNNTAWMAANREGWERLKGEFKALCVALTPFLNDLDPELETEPKTGRCLGRINRDIRFKADKRPYNEYIDVMFYPKSYGRTKVPGFAVGITAEHCYLGTWLGATMISWRERLVANIAAYPQIFEKYLAENDNFRDFSIDGESFKRQKVAGLPPLSSEWARRKFYYMGLLVPPEETVALGSEIVKSAEETILRLYPLLLFATSERPAADLELFRRKIPALG
jgi:uncharacterized protein (TIGR02453 family)